VRSNVVESIKSFAISYGTALIPTPPVGHPFLSPKIGTPEAYPWQEEGDGDWREGVLFREIYQTCAHAISEQKIGKLQTIKPTTTKLGN